MRWRSEKVPRCPGRCPFWGHHLKWWWGWWTSGQPPEKKVMSMKCVWCFFLGTSSFVPEMLRPMCFSLNAQGACTFDLFKTHHPMSLKLILLINIISSGRGHSSRIICMYIYINLMFIRSSLRFSQLTETGTYHWTYIYIWYTHMMFYHVLSLPCAGPAAIGPSQVAPSSTNSIGRDRFQVMAPTLVPWPMSPMGSISWSFVSHIPHIPMVNCDIIYIYVYMHALHAYIYIRVNIYSDLMPWPHWTHGECIGFNIANIVLFQVRDML